MQAIWDLISQSEPTWKCPEDAKQYTTHLDKLRLIQFLMALHPDVETVRASLLHRSPLPTLENAISELISEETRLGMLKSRRTDMVLATPSSTKFCKNSSSSAHTLARCPTVECRYYHKRGHILPYCPTRPLKPDEGKGKLNPKKESSQSSSAIPASATECSSSTTTTPSPTLTLSDLESILTQLRGKSSTTPVMSVLLGSADGTSYWDRT
ncbi:unnamed protein product [Linum trigynum]|uniref:Uncharacterized protein n=1 Tax=Linum trigynum TaxID=586398 RepID=A0AAV2GKI2_9ROSI